MTTLNSRLTLAMLNRKKGRNLLEKGFTLVELMIVIVIVGVLSAVALPNFLGVRDKAESGAEIGEFVGLAKECSAAILINGPYPKDYPASILGKVPGVDENCNGDTNDRSIAPKANIIFTGSPVPTDLGGTVACGPDLKIAAEKACVVTVNKDSGAITFTSTT